MSASLPDHALEAYLADLVAGRRRECLAHVDALLSAGVPLRTLYVELLSAALHEVGRRWERGELTVAIEHVATSITEEILAHMFPRATRLSRLGRRAVVSCAADDFHQLGGRIVADTLEAAGWDVDFVGAGAGVEELVAAVARTRPELVALSVSIRSHLPSLERSVHAVRRAQPRGLITVGGQGLAGDGAEVVAAWSVPEVEYVPSLEALEQLLSRGRHP
jgi:methanogenic corrinoid protein MtbC1